MSIIKKRENKMVRCPQITPDYRLIAEIRERQYEYLHYSENEVR
jgi:hypothetical protein